MQMERGRSLRRQKDMGSGLLGVLPQARGGRKRQEERRDWNRVTADSQRVFFEKWEARSGQETKSCEAHGLHLHVLLSASVFPPSP